jgi:pyruvate/2-oxoglutarate dehydrogenase complex dihydrolipoamide dehydrogenase (E3) component
MPGSRLCSIDPLPLRYAEEASAMTRTISCFQGGVRLRAVTRNKLMNPNVDSTPRVHPLSEETVMTTTFDAIVIGAGQAGPSLAERLGKAGLRTAIVERHLVGGTCVNTGCIPTKTLIGSARVAHLVGRAGEFGVQLDSPPRVDMRQVKARKDEVAGASRRGVAEWIDGMKMVTLIRGHARFVGPRSIVVGGDTLTAARIFVNVGARARVPDFPGLETIDYLTNSSMMDVDFIPEHLLIVGGSYVGLEFAQMYRRFGARVTVIEMQDRLISREDEDVSAAVQEILEGEGVQVRLEAECIGFERARSGVRMRIDCRQDSTPIEGSHVLLAVGRVPNTHDLGLGEAGIETDDKGHILVDEELRTRTPGVWALGEVNGRGAFTHTSYNDFEIVAANLLDADQRRVSDRILCYGLFIDPPLGRIGMTEREIRNSGRKALIGTRQMSRVGRAREYGDTRGFMKVLVDAETGKLLGASILGMSGDEVVHVFLDVMYTGQPYTVISRAMHMHPTVAELLPTLLQELEPLE